MRTRLFVLAAAVLLIGGCSNSNGLIDTGSDDGSTSGNLRFDAGARRDAGPATLDAGQARADAGSPADGGHVADAGTPGGLAWVTLTGPRRGPIELRFSLPPAVDGGAAFSSYALMLDKSGFVNATVLPAEVALGSITFVWDSFADLSEDRLVSLKLVASRGVSSQTVNFTLDVRNGLDPVRLMAVAQPLVPLPGGSTGTTGTGVSLVRWSPTDAGVAARRFETVGSVQIVRAAPHGRSVAVMGNTEMLLIKTPLDADLARAALSPVTALGGSPTDLQWSRDGRIVYLLSGMGGGRGPVLEAFRVKEDQSGFEAPVTVTSFDRPPLRFDIDKTTGRFIIVVGLGMTASTGKLLLLERDGGSVGTPLDRDWGVNNALTVSPRGDLAVLTSNYGNSGDQVFIVNIGPSGFGSVDVQTSIVTPFDVVFDPRSTATARTFVVSNQDGDGITSVTAGSTTTIRPKTGGIPLAFDLDMIERGPRVGTGFVVALQKIYQFNLSSTGLVQTAKAAYDFGGGTVNEPYAVAVQR